jgi:hypothetical protein
MLRRTGGGPLDGLLLDNTGYQPLTVGPADLRRPAQHLSPSVTQVLKLSPDIQP